MPNHQLGSIDMGFVDKRKAVGYNDPNSDFVGPIIFTANATGTTTTIVGANAAPGTNDVNVVRRTDRFKLYTAAGVPKEETVFSITSVAVAGSTTVTFSPAAAVAPVATDTAKAVDVGYIGSDAELDARLTAISATSYTASRLSMMSVNDKIYAVRRESDSQGI